MLKTRSILKFSSILSSSISSYFKSSRVQDDDGNTSADYAPAQLLMDFTKDGESPISLLEFYKRLNAELLKETKTIRHPLLSSFDLDISSWPEFLKPPSEYHDHSKVRFVLEKPFVTQEYDLVGVAQIQKKVGNWFEARSSEVTVGRSGHHGSVHSAFINGSLGAALTGIYTGIYSKGLKPLDWKNSSAQITFGQLLPRILRRLSILAFLLFVGGFGVDLSSQILEQYRRQTDVWNQVVVSAIIGTAVSLLVHRRSMKKAVKSAVLFSGLTFIHFQMDMIAAERKGITNSQFYY